MSKEHKIHKHIFSFHNLIWYSVLTASLVIPTGLYKKILPHNSIKENGIYLLENKNKELYCDLREGELPWRYSKDIKCKSLIPGNETLNKVYLENYDKITYIGK